MSRDEQNVLVVSYAELKNCLEQSYGEVRNTFHSFTLHYTSNRCCLQPPPNLSTIICIRWDTFRTYQSFPFLFSLLLLYRIDKVCESFLQTKQHVKWEEMSSKRGGDEEGLRRRWGGIEEDMRRDWGGDEEGLRRRWGREGEVRERRGGDGK